MNTHHRSATFVAALLLWGSALAAQTPAADSLHSVFLRLSARMDSIESGHCGGSPFEVSLTPTGDVHTDSLILAAHALADRVNRMALARCAQPNDRAEHPMAMPAPHPVAARAGGAYMNMGFDGLTDFGWSTASDIGALQRGDHDPAVRGFTAPNSEISLDGAVDPYLKGFSNIVFKLNANGETGVELEEMFFLTTSLPANLQVKAGQFFTEFGRQNSQHPHAWSFVDQPLVLNRMFGPDGLRSQGVRVSWLPPLPWYTEAMVSVMNSAGGTAFSFRSDESSEIHGGRPVARAVERPNDLLMVSRLASSVDLTPTQTLLFGASAAFGPNNSGANGRSRIYGADLYWKWKSARATQGFPFVSLQSEALVRGYDAAQRVSLADSTVTLPQERLKDWGVYSQLLWGAKPRWVLGLRGEVADGDSAAFNAALRTRRYRVSPNVTWYPSEFSKVRLQYNYDDRKDLGTDQSLWMQVEFMLGAHAAHKF